MAVACGGTPQAAPPPGVSTVDLAAGAPSFDYVSLDSRPVSSGAFLGKPAVIGFVTTYDPVSQLQVNILVPLAADLGGRASFALVALQDASARELVELYRETLKVTFPVALADSATIAGGGPFGDVHVIPTLVVLAPDGRIAWKHVGPAHADEIRKHVERLLR